MYDNLSLRPNPEWIDDRGYATTSGGAHAPCGRTRFETFSGRRVIPDIKYVCQRTEQGFVPLNACSSDTGGASPLWSTGDGKDGQREDNIAPRAR